MPENLGIADSFAQGQEYALKKNQVDLQREQLDFQKKQLAKTQEQQRIQMGIKLMEDWDGIHREMPGPVQKARLAVMKQNYAMLSLPWDPILEANATDERGRAKWMAAYTNYANLPPDMQAEVAMNAGAAIGEKNMMPALDKMAAFNMDMVKQREKDKADANKPPDQDQDRKFVSAEREILRKSKEFQEYSSTGLAVRGLLDATTKRSPFRDTATIYTFMKLLDPNSVVNASDQGLFVNTGSAFTHIGNMMKKLYSGEALNPNQRRELLSIGRSMLAKQQVRYMSAAETALKDLEGQGFKRDRVDPALPIIEKDRKFFQKLDKDFRFESTDEEKEAGIAGIDEKAPTFAPKVIATVRRMRAIAKGDKAKADKAYGSAISDALWELAE